MREYEKQKEEFRKWLLDTYPGERGKNRRDSFMKFLTTIEDIAGADLELEMTRVPTDKFGDTVMELDKANAMAGWYRSTLNCWKYFQEEKTGIKEPGTQKRVVMRRDEKKQKRKDKGDDPDEPHAKRRRIGYFREARKTDLSVLVGKKEALGSWVYRRREVAWDDKEEVEKFKALAEKHPVFYAAERGEDSMLFYQALVYCYPDWRTVAETYA
eukprot:Rhum_TRINITY_DN10487_c1_g1::Rhum_TRINITY_DN10487_c1_g1_i1::g.38616::m.38616